MRQLPPYPTRSGRSCVADRRIAAALLLACALVPFVRTEAHAAPPSDDALTRYRVALTALPPLRNIVFRYTESRSGPTRALAEEHRVYRRADGEERNETIAVNGVEVVPAIVHYASKPIWPYDVRQFAVYTLTYNVLAQGQTVVSGKRAYGFSTVLTTPGDFAVTGLYLDVARYLPLRETFTVTGGDCRGNGSIDFAPFGPAWLPTTASVTCSVAQDNSTFKESIVFHDYAFVQVLPPDVFGGRP